MSLMSCQKHSSHEGARFKTIMIKSFGEVETLPNMATIQVTLNCLDKSIQVSKTCLVDKSNELTTKLQSFGISSDDILTTSVSMDKSYTWRSNSRVFEGYRSSTTVYVTVKNIDNLDKIYTDLLGNENLQIGGLSYSHSKLDSLENEAYVKALEKSGILADKLLSKLSESKKEILKIGNVEISASIPEVNQNRGNAKYEMEEASLDKNKSVSTSKGTVDVTATLYVEYQIK